MSSKDTIRSKIPSKEYLDNWEKVFGRKLEKDERLELAKKYRFTTVYYDLKTGKIISEEQG